MSRVFWSVLTMLTFASSAWADQVHLANGQVLEGIVLREGETQVVVQVAWESHIVLDRASVLRIEPAKEAERSALLTRWREDDAAFKSREAQARAFEESQRSKGLVLYRGEWITKEELAAVRAEVRTAEAERAKREAAEQSLKREEETRKRLEAELSATTERLRAIQEEQLRLQQEITSLRHLLADQRFHRTFPQHFPVVVRDPQGRTLRVISDASHTIVQLPDGSHCDLVFNGTSYSYIDQAGVLHRVEPVGR